MTGKQNMSLKKEYWQNGKIFEFNTGAKRFVWFDNLIDSNGFIPKEFFNDDLVNIHSVTHDYVVRIYGTNTTAKYFSTLLEVKLENLLWEKSKYIFTAEEIKNKLNIPLEQELIIIQKRK